VYDPLELPASVLQEVIDRELEALRSAQEEDSASEKIQ
jgi:hypothetical protein